MANPTDPFILIVDDNPTNLSVLSQALKAAGYKVRMAVDGEDALDKVSLAHPELILLDVQMPKIDGFETCRRLQANPETAGIPVIFMTALTDTDNKVKGLSLGAVDYLTKPFEQQEVLARVRVHWRLKQLTDSLEQQVTERSQSLQQAQIQLVQQEKFSALGQLIAGIGHELNNPLGCIASNLPAATQYLADITELLNLYGQYYSPPVAAIAATIEDIDLPFTLEDFSKLLESMKVASDRMKDISESLRRFARSDSQEKTSVDLHEGLESTLMLLQHRLKANAERPAIEIIKQYGNLPQVQCYPGLLNQVLMNILANAIDALDEFNQNRSFEEIEAQPNQITLCTAIDQNQIKISISDNGSGMPPEIRDHIFDYQFTTKSVGKGTGLGLAIAQQIIVEKHCGVIKVESEVGQGTKFVVLLPIG
jgi:signal transduction histidine kinase